MLITRLWQLWPSTFLVSNHIISHIKNLQQFPQDGLKSSLASWELFGDVCL